MTYLLQGSRRSNYLIQEHFEKQINIDSNIQQMIYVGISMMYSEIYIQSAPNNSNETYTFMCLGRAGRFGQC